METRFNAYQDLSSGVDYEIDQNLTNELPKGSLGFSNEYRGSLIHGGRCND